MGEASLRISVDASAAEALIDDMSSLTQAGQLPLEVRDFLLSGGEPAFELFGVELEELSAGVASHLRMALQPTDRLRGLLAAMRAGQIDLGVIEHGSSPCAECAVSKGDGSAVTTHPHNHTKDGGAA